MEKSKYAMGKIRKRKSVRENETMIQMSEVLKVYATKTLQV